MFWLLVYLIGMGAGSTIAWLAGADVNLQMLLGLATGFCLSLSSTIGYANSAVERRNRPLCALR
ncbi:MAG: hypothetical protein HZY76_15830 [Anaerolineae bacterium]|nr:MAG: hypothetical protein HZY76_15830 [Anaerolineae bacterium]